MKINVLAFLVLFYYQLVLGQSEIHKDQIKKIFNQALTNGRSYDWLDHLSNQIGGRLSGSLNAERAVIWGHQQLNEMGLDRVYLEDIMVPKWVRGEIGRAHV